MVTLDTLAYPAARIIWKMENGNEPPEVDHRDNDTLNNKLENLRAATHSQNSQNRRRKRMSDLPKGVQVRGRRFAAFITANGKRHYLGTFDTPELAAFAYKNGVILYHGEYGQPPK